MKSVALWSRLSLMLLALVFVNDVFAGGSKTKIISDTEILDTFQRFELSDTTTLEGVYELRERQMITYIETSGSGQMRDLFSVDTTFNTNVPETADDGYSRVSLRVVESKPMLRFSSLRYREFAGRPVEIKFEFDGEAEFSVGTIEDFKAGRYVEFQLSDEAQSLIDERRAKSLLNSFVLDAREIAEGAGLSVLTSEIVSIQSGERVRFVAEGNEIRVVGFAGTRIRLVANLED